MAKDLKMVLLLDYYGAFLTARQQEMMYHYYCEDLSLGEIALLAGMTRQAVRDSIKRSEQILSDMEEKLQFAEKFYVMQAHCTTITETAAALAAMRSDQVVQEACQIICQEAEAGLQLLQK